MVGTPWSEACERNKEPILSVLRAHFVSPGRVLEIGSGTGQHAAYLAAQLPHLVWQPSDVAQHLPGIQAWVDQAGLINLLSPRALDVAEAPWPVEQLDYVFSANTAHIMAWPQVMAMMAGVGRVLTRDGVFCLYGPFNYGGAYTSESNASFDNWLKARDPESGIRDFEALDALAQRAGLTLVRDHAMPANNRTLVWRKQ